MPQDRAADATAQEIGRRVRRYRLATSDRAGRNMSQERLAELAGIHRTHVGMIERGEIDTTAHNLVKIAAALRIDPADLLSGIKPRRRRS